MTPDDELIAAVNEWAQLKQQMRGLMDQWDELARRSSELEHKTIPDLLKRRTREPG